MCLSLRGLESRKRDRDGPRGGSSRRLAEQWYGAMNRLRHDLDFLVSIGLLATAFVTGLTGLISDLWDLNDFWYHTVSGYLMGGFAIAHVVLNWNRLVSYAGFRVQTVRWRGSRPDRPRPRGEGWLGKALNPSSRRRGWAGPSCRDAASSGSRSGHSAASRSGAGSARRQPSMPVRTSASCTTSGASQGSSTRSAR